MKEGYSKISTQEWNKSETLTRIFGSNKQWNENKETVGYDLSPPWKPHTLQT